MVKKVRLKEGEIETIKGVILSFDPDAEIVLFGSRTDLGKKGGDIDLLVVSKKNRLPREEKDKGRTPKAVG